MTPTLPARLLRTSLTGALLALLLSPAFAAAAPRDDLLRLVPEDITFGLLVQDLREHTRPLQETLGDERLPSPAFWQGLALPPEFQAILKQQEKLLRDLDLGVTPRQFLT